MSNQILSALDNNKLDIIIQHNMESDILNYCNIDIKYAKTKGYLKKILKFKPTTISHILNNSINLNYDDIIFDVCNYSKDYSFIESCINKCSNINIRDNHQKTILHYLCYKYFPNMKIIQYCVNRGVDFNIYDSFGELCVDNIFKINNNTNNISIIQYFDSIYDNIIKRSKHLIKILTTRHNNDKTILYLVDKYENQINIKYHICNIIKFCKFETLCHIINKYNISLKDKYTVISICNKYCHDIKAITHFVNIGLDLNIIDNYENTMLNIITRKSKNKYVIKFIIDYFINNKLDINKTNKLGNNPITNLIYKIDNPDIFECILYIIPHSDLNIKYKRYNSIIDFIHSKKLSPNLLNDINKITNIDNKQTYLNNIFKISLIIILLFIFYKFFY